MVDIRRNTYDNVLIILVHLVTTIYSLLSSSRLGLQVIRSTIPIPDLIAVGVNLVGLATFSTLCISYHTVSLFDVTLGSSWRRLEQVGIVVLIWSSTVPFLYFQFYNDKRCLWFYLWLMTITAVRCGSHLLRPAESSSHVFAFACVIVAVLPFLCMYHVLVWGSACHTPMISHFIKYMVPISLGGIVYVIGLPRHYMILLERVTSTYIIHLLMIYAAILYTGTVVVASESAIVTSSRECQAWM